MMGTSVLASAYSWIVKRTAVIPATFCGLVQRSTTEVFPSPKVAVTPPIIAGGIYWREDGAVGKPSISAPGIAALAPALYIGVTANA